MPDITMCHGSGLIVNGRIKVDIKVDDLPKNITECPKKETCFRHKATPSEFRQAYFVGIPCDPTNDDYRHFLPMYKKAAVDALDGPVEEDVIKFLKDWWEP